LKIFELSYAFGWWHSNIDEKVTWCILYQWKQSFVFFLFFMNQRDGSKLITATTQKMAIATIKLSRSESKTSSVAPTCKMCGHGQGAGEFFTTLETKHCC